MYLVKGDFGQMVFEGGTSRSVILDTDAAVTFFQTLGLVKSNIIKNSLGLYSYGRLDRRGRIRFGNLSIPSYLLKPEALGCGWDPVQGISGRLKEIESETYDFQGEQCPDVFLKTFFRGLYANGNDGRDFLATAEGKAMWGMVLENTFIGLSNSFYNVVDFTNHPIVEKANENGWYLLNNIDEKTWARAYKMYSGRKIMGHMALIDTMKGQGVPNAALAMDRGSVSVDGNNFIEDITTAFDKVLEARPQEMKKYSDSVPGGKTVLMVTKSAFKAYRKHILDTYPSIPDILYYFMNGQFAASIGVQSRVDANQVLMYDGHPVVYDASQEEFDNLTGTKTHRILALSPKVLGVGLDVPAMEQYDGSTGLRLNQKLEAPYNGMIYMDTRFDVAPGLVNENHFVNYSITLTPSASEN